MRYFCLATLWVASFATQLLAGKSDGRLDIYWVDVEGGAATLIVTPADESILIDTGNPGRRDPDRIAKVVTEVARLKQIDHLIITHYHRDHFGGATTLATMLPIKNMYDNGVFEGMPDNPGKAYFDLKCENRVVINPGDVLPLSSASRDDGPVVKLTCVAARKQFIKPTSSSRGNESVIQQHKPKDRDGSDNANSVAVLLEFGDFQFFDGGDLTWNQELNLVYPRDLIGEVDVYQVTHHGLSSSNNPVVLQTLKPKVAIMNNGHKKGCMPEVFANLKATRSIEAIFQVHKNLRPDGKVNNVGDGHIANFHAAEECEGHYIQLSVAPDASEYTVSIPAHQRSARFSTKK